ncbi:hypothetical protein ACROYT_G021127 [Oculina patagonica]
MDRVHGGGPWTRVHVLYTSGRTGNEVVKQALEKGHHVTAVVRTPEKLTTQRENLLLVKGDACDVESFAAALDGKDAVLSSLGVYANIFNPTTFYSESINAITEAMSRLSWLRGTSGSGDKNAAVSAFNKTQHQLLLLLSGEQTGNYKVEEGQCNTGTTNKITCADVAECMLKTLESNEYDRKGIAIAGL